MPSAQTATTLKSAYNLIEDYVLTMQPPIAQSVAGCFQVVQNDRETVLLTELVTLSNQNNLLRFFRDSQSNSGWNHEEITVDGAPDSPIQKIVSFYQKQTLYALAHYPATGGNNIVIGMQRTLDTDWGPMPFDPDLQNALGQMQQTDAFRDAMGNQFFYGISLGFQPSSFVLVGQDPDSGTWMPMYLEPAVNPTASYRILPGYNGNQMTVVTIDGANATFRGGSIVNNQLVWDGQTPVTHDLGQGPITADQVFAVPSTSGDQGFLLLGNDHQLFHVSGYDAAQIIVTPLTGGALQPGGVLSVSIGQAQQNLYMVFAIDTSDQMLWLLRQTSSSDDTVKFDPWVPLGNNLGALSCPAVMGTGPELLYYDLNSTVGHMCQQVEQGNWFTQPIVSPSPVSTKPTPTSTYSNEFVTADEDGNAVPRSVVKVTSDRPTVAIINSVSYHIDSQTPATVISDTSGRVTVSTISNSLVSPALKISSETLKTLGPFRSDLLTHQRLAGADPTFPVNGATMQAAGLIPSSINQGDADALASKTRSLGVAAVSMQNKTATGKGTNAFRAMYGTGWEIDFTRTSGMIRNLSPEEAATLRSVALSTSLSDIWGDICNFFRHVIDDLKKLAVTFANDVVYVSVTLADGVKNFILKTLAEVGDCIEIFLQAVASLAKDVVDAIEMAIKWLRMLFDWDDIIRTKKVVRYYIDQSLKNLASDFNTTIPKDLIAAFTKAKSEIVDVFNNLEQLFEQGVSFNDIGPSSSSEPVAQGGPPYEGVSGKMAYQVNAVQCNYVHSKVLSAPSSMFAQLTMPATSSFDPSQLLELFKQTFPTAEIEQSWQKIKNFSSDVHDAKSFLDVAVLDVMEAIKDILLLILSGIEAILLALSEMMGAAFEGIDTLLTAGIDIPIISEIYKLFAHEDLSVLDLMSLLLALPATILYKLLYGGPNLNPPFTESDVDQILANPIPWPSFRSNQSLHITSHMLPLPEASTLDRILAVLFCLSTCVYTVCDIGLDGQAAADNSGDDQFMVAAGPDPTIIAGIISIVASVAIQGFGVPYAAIKRINEKQGTSADTWAIVAWCTAWIPPLLDTAFVILSPSKKVTRFQSKGGPFLSLAAGAVMMGCGAKAVHEMRQDTTNYNVSNQAAVLLPTFPYLFQPIVLAGMDTPPTLALQGALWLIDIAGDFGTGIAALVAIGPNGQTKRMVAA